MRIPDYILEIVRTNPTQAAHSACDFVLDMIEQTADWSHEEHNLLLECYALISAMVDANLISLYAELRDIDADLHSACIQLYKYLEAVYGELEKDLADHRLEAMKSKFADLVTHGFSYEFTEGDVNRIQVLIN